MSLVGGFGFTERMVGEYTGRAPGFPGGAFRFEVEFECEDLGASLREAVGRAEGRLTMAGVAEAVTAEGTMTLSPFWKRRIGYELRFTAPDGRRLRFAGAKKINWLRPFSSWTTLPGTVTDEESGEVVADVVARFDVRKELGAFLKSYRITAGRSAEPERGAEPERA
jgi:hypothetical protein